MNGASNGWTPDGSDGVLRIDCDHCTMQHTNACDDCVVTFLCGPPRPAGGGGVVLDATEALAMRTMVDVGLVPALRLERRPAG